MKKIYIKGYKKHKYSTDIFEIRIFNFLAYWITDCDEWFIYIYFGRRWLRFSGAGFMKGIFGKEEFVKWINSRNK